MKTHNWIITLALLLFWTSCAENPQSIQENFGSQMPVQTVGNSEPELSIEVEAESAEPRISEHPELLGNYVGILLRSNKIHFYPYAREYSRLLNISIEFIEGNSVEGRLISEGEAHPLKGTVIQKDSIWEMEIHETGEKLGDGKFMIRLFPNGEINCVWRPSHTASYLENGEAYLKKKTFSYDPHRKISFEERFEGSFNFGVKNSGLTEFWSPQAWKINASARIISKREIENLYKGDLELIRYAIYARHGLSFSIPEMGRVFEKDMDWYVPVSTDVSADLTEIEKKNIDLLKRYEEHAERYYAEFAR